MCMFQLVQGVAQFIRTLNSIHLSITDKAPLTRYRLFIFKEEIVKVLKVQYYTYFQMLFIFLCCTPVEQPGMINYL